MTDLPRRAVTRTGAPPLRSVPTRTLALATPRVAVGAAACACPATMKVMSFVLLPLAMDAPGPRLRAGDIASAPDRVLRQTVKGSCARNGPAVPRVNRLGVCVAGMRALMRAWKLP